MQPYGVRLHDKQLLTYTTHIEGAIHVGVSYNDQ